MTINNPTPTIAPAPRRRGGKKALPILAAVLSAGVIAAFATTSFGQGYGPGYGSGNGGGPGYGRGMGPGMGPGYGPGGDGPGWRGGDGPGWRGGDGPGWRQGGGPGFWRGGPFGGGTIDPAWAESRADRMARYLAIEIGANADQQEKLAAIAKVLVKEVLPVREKMLTARKQARELLTAEKVDRAALEKLRAEQIATHEAASKRLVQALADAADILTPEQRKKLNELLPSRGGWGFGRGGWGFGHGMGRGMGMGWGGWR